MRAACVHFVFVANCALLICCVYASYHILFAAADLLHMYICSYVHSSVHPGDLNSLRSWIEDQLSSIHKREKSSRSDIHNMFEHEKEIRQRLEDIKKNEIQKQNVMEDMMAAMKKLENELNMKINQT